MGIFFPRLFSFQIGVKAAIALCAALERRERESFGCALGGVGSSKRAASGEALGWRRARSAGVKAPGGQWRTGCCGELEAASPPGWLLTQETQGDISEGRAGAGW